MRVRDIIEFDQDGLVAVGIIVAVYSRAKNFSVRIEAYRDAKTRSYGHPDYSNTESLPGKQYWTVEPHKARIIKTIKECPQYARSEYARLYNA